MVLDQVWVLECSIFTDDGDFVAYETRTMTMEDGESKEQAFCTAYALCETFPNATFPISDGYIPVLTGITRRKINI